MPLLLLLLCFSTLLHQSQNEDVLLSEAKHNYERRETNTGRDSSPGTKIDFEINKRQEEETLAAIVPAEVQPEIIDIINSLRREVQPTASNMVKMSWSDEAAKSALDWIKQCKPGPSPAKERIVDGVFCGESRLQSDEAVSWTEIINMWKKRKSNYQYGVGAIDPEKDIFTYTQLIWYDTFSIGCALAYCDKNEGHKFLYVCRTCPAGNIRELVSKPYKDGPSCEDCPKACENKLCTNPCRYKNGRRDCKHLINEFGCSTEKVKTQCKASCECTDHII